MLGEGADLGLVGPFRHHAQQRLGARVSHHQPPPAVEGGARPVQRLAHFRDRLDVLLLAHAHVPQHLRVHEQLAPQLRQRAARVPDDLQDLERGEEAVARGLVVEEDDVAALLTAQVRPAPFHLLEHVAVAHRGAHQRDAELAQRDLQAHVAHHGRHHGAALEPARALQVPRGQEQDVVAVDDLARFVRQDAAVPVPVEGQPGVGAHPPHQIGYALGGRGAAVPVDVAAIGLVGDGGHPRAQTLEQRPREERRGAVGAIHGQMQPGQRRAVVRAGQVVQVGAREVALMDRRRVEQRPLQAVDRGLRLLFQLRAELAARAAEHLDAVVFVWVVRGGDHHTQVIAAAAHAGALAGQVRDGRSGDHARRFHLRAFRGQARRQMLLDGRPALAGVAADEHPRSIHAQRAHDGAPDPLDRGRVQGRLARPAADSVRAEETTHQRLLRGGGRTETCEGTTSFRVTPACPGTISTETATVPFFTRAAST